MGLSVHMDGQRRSPLRRGAPAVEGEAGRRRDGASRAPAARRGDRERGIARVAARQHGAIARRQLLELGLPADTIAGRLKDGRLHALYRGVYLVGPPPGPARAPEMGAVLACGPGAVLSHRSAGRLWGLSIDLDDEPDVTVPGRDPGRKRGIRTHRTRTLSAPDRSAREGIPVTAPARTVLDLAEIVSPAEVERVLAEAERSRLFPRRLLGAALARHPGRRGAAVVRAAIAGPGPALTRSEAERRLLDLIRAANLDRPRLNARVGAYEVDFLWPDQRLVVEVDGFAFHADRKAFESDRRRDGWLAARGYHVIRVTWRQIVEQPEATLATVAMALAARSDRSP